MKKKKKKKVSTYVRKKDKRIRIQVAMDKETHSMASKLLARNNMTFQGYLIEVMKNLTSKNI